MRGAGGKGAGRGNYVAVVATAPDVDGAGASLTTVLLLANRHRQPPDTSSAVNTGFVASPVPGM